jgi:hypothetical protein
MHEVGSTEGAPAAIRQRLASAAPELLREFPINAYISALDASDEYSPYMLLPPRIQGWCSEARGRHGADVLEDYHRLLLLSLVESFEAGTRARGYPESILELLRKYLRVVVAQLARNPQGFYLPENDLFLKDLGVCRQTLLPCGAQLVERRAAIPRSWSWKGGFRRLPGFALYVASHLRGFRPLYQLHMDSRLLLEFNPAGWERCYRRIAELLISDPAVRGVFGASWWFDPQLEHVSPRLAFLRTLPESNGARVFRIGEREAATRFALANSKQRQELYAQGHYRPADYLLVWGREDLLAWANTEA